MFRKIVSNLPFSPALVGQLGFYARRLRKEETTRRAGLIVTALALVVQSFAVFSPPEAVNAASSADFVPGGVSSKNTKDLLSHYDKNTGNIKKVLTSLGITRAELAATTKKTIGEKGHYNWSRTSLYSYAQGQRSWDYGGGNVYYRPMTLTAGAKTTHAVFAGKSKEFGWFAIKIDCGNLVTDKEPPKPFAACANLVVSQLSTTRFKFTGKATKKHGATISGYTYQVYNANNKLIKTIKSSSKKETSSVTYDQKATGKYSVQLTVLTSKGKLTGNNCRAKFSVNPNPEAICEKVTATIADRTIVSIGGNASARNGATIKKYTFIITDKNGKAIKSITVDSSASAVSVPSFTLEPGTYSVKLTVGTSLGDKTNNTDCVTSFTVPPPEVCPYNNQLPLNSPDCQPCPDNPDVWIKDEKCAADIIKTKTASNLSLENVDATTKTAQASNRISYTITAENKGLIAEEVELTEDLKDVLEYATMLDTGGGTFNKDTKKLTWGTVDVPAKSKESRTFVVQIMKKIPLINTGVSNEDSFDCKMVNTFGNATQIRVDCPVEKEVVERVVEELPTTGPGENMMFASILLAIVAYFYARSRQLGKEVRLIRKSAHAGTI